jgi:hypothetical protein
MSTSTLTRPRQVQRPALSRRRPHLVTVAVGLCTAAVSAVWVTAVAAPALTPTQSALRSSLNPSVEGQAVTLVATVSAGGGAATGTVDFKDGATLLATRPVSAGRSSLTVSTLSIGDHPVTADYSGDSTYAASTSPAVTQTVATAGTAGSTTTLSSSANPSTVGQAVTLVATVAGTGGAPTGSVSFRDGDATLSVRPLSGGRASLVTSSLAAGPHTLTAAYGGDPTFAASTSGAVSQAVSPPGTTATRSAVVSSANPSRGGVPVTFTATVSSAAGTPTGSVTFKDGTTVLAVRPLAGGRSTLTLRTLAAGPHSITAVYSGSPSFATSTSPPVSQSVTAGAAPAPSGSAHAAPMARGEHPMAGATMTR